MGHLNKAWRLVAAVALVAGLLAVIAPTTALASPTPSGGAAAVWDHTTWPGLFGSFESDQANGFTACFSNIGSGTTTLVSGGPECDGAQEVYYAAVGNGEDFGLGAAQTSVTVQNIDVNDAYVFIYVGNSDGSGWTESQWAYLSAGASKTFTASQLGIPDGDNVPVVAALYQVLLGSVDCVANDGGGYTCSYVDADGVVHTFQSATDISLAFGIGAFGAGVAKQAVTGANLPYTTAADTSVSGYNAVSGREVGFFDELYFPIVQTNCGPGGCWDTDLRLSNVGQDKNAAVTVRFFPADDGSGSLQTGFQLQALLNPGQLWTIDLADWVPQGWVGSAHVYTDDAVVGIADRFKAGTSMWITNTASNASAEAYWQFPGGPSEGTPFALWAPDVRTDYNGWNTGIDVTSTCGDGNDPNQCTGDTNVTIQYFGNGGNAPEAQNQRLAAQGMTYFYNPSQPSEDRCQQPATDPAGCEFVGGAIILSDNPVAAVIDGVKYFGNDANVGQAFSYSATGNVFNAQTAPLVQKGNPSTGLGATSGINFLNPNSTATTVTTYWINPSGFGASNFAPSVVWVPAYATGFTYTMFQHNLPNGFYGSAYVVSDYPIAATTANVDYQVAGDGTAIWNLYNPCGFFRQSGYPSDTPDCYQPILGGTQTNGTITKTVTCTTCDFNFDGTPDANVVVAGAQVSFDGTDVYGHEFTGNGMTNSTGTVTFAVPAGTYDVTIEGLPAGFTCDVTCTDTGVVVNAGDAVQLTNDVFQAPLAGQGILTKFLDLGDFNDGVISGAYSLQSDIWFCSGVDSPCANVTDPNFESHGGYSNVPLEFDTYDFEFSHVVPAGQYTICSQATVSGDFDNDPTTPNESITASYSCESTGDVVDPTTGDVVPNSPIVVQDGQETYVVNNFLTETTGPVDVYVGDASGAPLAGATVTIRDQGGNVVASGDTDATGAFSADLPAGTYSVSASDAGYEDQSATKDYDQATDAANGGLVDDLTVFPNTADYTLLLDPTTPPPPVP